VRQSYSARYWYRLDVTRWYCVVTAQPIVRLSSLSGSPMILVFEDQTFSRNSNGNTPTTALNARGRKKLQFPTNISLLLVNGCRWVYAAMRLTSIESSFHPCDYLLYRDSGGRVPPSPQGLRLCLASQNVLLCRRLLVTDAPDYNIT